MAKCDDCGTVKNLVKIQPQEFGNYYYFLCVDCYGKSIVKGQQNTPETKGETE